MCTPNLLKGIGCQIVTPAGVCPLKLRNLSRNKLPRPQFLHTGKLDDNSCRLLRLVKIQQDWIIFHQVSVFPSIVFFLAPRIFSASAEWFGGCISSHQQSLRSSSLPASSTRLSPGRHPAKTAVTADILRRSSHRYLAAGCCRAKIPME